MRKNYCKRLKSYFPGSLRSTFRREELSVLLPLPKLHPSRFSSSLTQRPSIASDPPESSNSREYNLHSLFKKCSTLKNVYQIHAQIIQTGFEQNLFMVAKIITFCADSEHGPMDYAVSVFEQIRNPDGFLWNTMIRGFGKTSKPDNALGFYKRMLHKGEVADNFTYSFLLKICGQLRSVELDIETARQLFEEIPTTELVAWNIIIDCYVHCGHYKEALELFSRMQQISIEPNDATLVVVLSACAELGALDFGRWIHSQIDYTSFSDNISVSNSLIDMYAKCGVIDNARQVFNKMNSRNIVSWNSMILGLAMHGYADDALELFSKMMEGKLAGPNDITFLGVLCACSHRGLVDEGKYYFDVMKREYQFQPTIKHYGCMVDLLGRAGFVMEAYQLIRSMPMECNAIVWRTLLGACRVHGNVQLGERVRRHLLELEPDHSGDYVLLANMYASAGQWNEVCRVRTAMKNRAVQKPKPGNSSIDVGSTEPCNIISTTQMDVDTIFPAYTD
ncbi:putative pentatricopeptide repeat-containing protein At5g59200, chloroplastic isoform X2 [Macadamia integrifolia]|uniref:putative pentatricopeptide repeat-containing protein At5g59200, chloroplastic isoform X2 n=1 Tax=Macadamia integrifolia TaxID=60698 RepID=UPI001C4FC10E|nr:putative pentatricopeptide repeat-containing protein At5g59200, chloroplastic isoform X2 [Macadamia integrifolia]